MFANRTESSTPTTYLHNRAWMEWRAQGGDSRRVSRPDRAAKDRGCTKPGCDAPAYHSQVHHVQGWTKTRRTDINDLTLACGPHNRLVEKAGFTTRKNAKGDTE